MIGAVILVLACGVVVTAAIVLANFVNKSKEDEKPLEHDEKTGVFYDPDVLERTEKNGVVSFKSKDK
jgi:hypothetical protein